MRQIFRRHGLFFFAIVCFILALFMIVTGARANRRCTVETTAVVSDYAIERDSDGDVYYHPVVEYTVNGETYEAQGSHGSGDQPYSIGETVSIRYNPADYTDFVFDGDHSMRNWGIYLIGVGILLIVIEILSVMGLLPAGQRRY